MTTLDDFLEEQLKDPEFKTEYDSLEPEFALMQAILDARNSEGLTQAELSERTGISQADISRLEHGNGNPSLRTLKRIASALHMVLKIDLQPMGSQSIG